MSHLNILNISREIENINKNILSFQKQITRIESEENRNSDNIQDLDEMKMNKIEVISSLEKIRDDFKFLESKIENVDLCVKNLVNRNIDYVGKNKEKFKNFLEKILLNEKKINIILYVLDCSNVQDLLSINEEEFVEFNFSQSEIELLYRKSKDELESNIYSDVGM